MAESRLRGAEQTKIRNVPIAVTPEGFWCCPSPAAFQKTLKAQTALNKPKTPDWSHEKKHTPPMETNPPPAQQSRSGASPDDRRDSSSDTPGGPAASAAGEKGARPKTENLPRKVAIEFGEPGTGDLRVILRGKHGFCVKLNVHWSVLAGKSSCFADKLSGQQAGGSSSVEIDDCEDVEIYVETVGLMYCKEIKQRLIKQSVSRVLRILKVAELLGFTSCIQSCLEYLEAVPWASEEEDKVVSSVLHLQTGGIGVIPVLKRVSSDASDPPGDTLSQIMELVLKSSDERGRREMKSVVLKLLKEKNTTLRRASAASNDFCTETVYRSCKTSLHSLLSMFKQAGETKGKQIALEVDNLSWLLEILADRQAADEFAVMWVDQQELAVLHAGLPVVARYHVSLLTARLFVVIGSGEVVLPSKDTRQMLLQTWLQPLIDDYGWLQHGRKSIDRRAVEEGIGRTILTLPLEEQQSILLSWLGSFLKAGDQCPNLQKAFEVWWRRTFIRPYLESRVDSEIVK